MDKSNPVCYDCGKAYGTWPDFYAPYADWCRYGPYPGTDSGVLCLNCYAQRLVRAHGFKMNREGIPLAVTIMGDADLEDDSAPPDS